MTQDGTTACCSGKSPGTATICGVSSTRSRTDIRSYVSKSSITSRNTASSRCKVHVVVLVVAHPGAALHEV